MQARNEFNIGKKWKIKSFRCLCFNVVEINQSHNKLCELKIETWINSEIEALLNYLVDKLIVHTRLNFQISKFQIWILNFNSKLKA